MLRLILFLLGAALLIAGVIKSALWMVILGAVLIVIAIGIFIFIYMSDADAGGGGGDLDIDP